MNKRILLALCLIAASLQGVLAQCYLVNDATSYQIQNGWSTTSDKTFTIATPRPGDKLTFNFSKAGVGIGGVTVTATYLDNTSETLLSKGTSSSYDIPLNNKILSKLVFSANGTLTKSISNVKVTQATYVEPSSNNISCGNVEVQSSSTDTKFSVAWSDAKPLTLTLDNTTDFALSTASIASSPCNYGTESNIIIDFHPQTKGTKTATVTISDSDNKTWSTINLTGVADGIPQIISWWDEGVTMLSRGDTIGSDESPFVQTSSGLAFTTLTSSDPSVLKIEGGKLIAVAAGTATITAYQAGTSTIKEATATLSLEVTNLLTQRITWTQNLNFKWGDASTELTATTSSGLPITYELVDNTNNVVTLVGNTINISTTNAGIATIRAIQLGDGTYAAISYLRTLRVRDPNASCINEPLALEDNNEYSLSTIQTGPAFNLDGYPNKLTFQAKKSWLGINYFFVQQYVGGSWSDVYNPSLSDSYATYTTNLNRNATKIRFLTKTGATLSKYYKNIAVTRAHFIESNPTNVAIDAQFETMTKKTIKVTYSNIQDVIDVRMASSNPEFSVSPSSFAGNECGEYGTINVVVSYTPSSIENDLDTVIIGNAKDGEIKIPIATTVQKRAQYISWALSDSLASIQTYTLNKTNPVSGLPITYNISDETILQLDANNKLVFLQVDTVITITATCPGNDYYMDADPVIKTIRIFKGLPILVPPTAGDTIYFGEKLGLIPLIGGYAKDLSGDTIHGDFRWKNYLEVPNAGNPVSCAITFIPTNSTIYGDVSDFIPVVVLKLPQTLEWTMNDSIGILDSITLDARVPSGLKISYNLSGEGASYASIGANEELILTATTEALGKTLTITAWQVGNHNYLPSDTVSYTVVISKTIANFFAATEPSTYGTRLNDVVIYVDYNVSGSWSYDDTSNPMLDVCHYNLSATFTPTNLELCDPSHVLIPVNIIPATTTINTIPTASDLTQGESLLQSTLTGGSASVAGTFMWAQPGFIPAVGANQEFDVIFKPNSKNYATVTCKVAVTVISQP